MEIKIHRGLEQIGGCITEISTATSRVFIDLGQNLPGNGVEQTPEQDKLMIENLFNSNKKDNEAVFYTHGHEDHIGLFEYVPMDVPQFMSTGTKELILIKYRTLIEGNELTLEQIGKDDYSQKELIEKTINQNISIGNKIELISRMKTWNKTSPRKKPSSITIGNITITPFFNCHSIYDSHMFLIEAEGKRIWHTGDYRSHGYMGKGLYPTLKKYATHIDTLITEGTMLNRQDECIHESKVANKMANVMQAFKYIFVVASATDIERLASIKNATIEAKKPMYVFSKFLVSTMKLFTKLESESSHGLFDFTPRLFKHNYLNRLRNRGFVLITGTSQISRIAELLKELPTDETLLVYSTWDCYYKIPEQVLASPKHKLFRELFSNVVDIHTSGHADIATIKKVIEIVKPKEIICIHKEANAELKW